LASRKFDRELPCPDQEIVHHATNRRARLWPLDASSITQAAAWPTTSSAGANGGGCCEQTGSAKAQRVLKRQPGGGWVGLGGSPIKGGRVFRFAWPIDGRLASSAWV
jgi:hypothetical protein